MKTNLKFIAGWIALGLILLLILSILRASFFSEVVEEKRIWFELSFLLLAAVMAELLVVRLKQPTVMILLVLGIVISPSAITLIVPVFYSIASFLAGLVGASLVFKEIPHLVDSDGVIQVFAQLGAILLLFKIGLHSEIKEIFNVRNFVVGILGIIIPFTAGFYYASFMGHGFAYAMFLGAALTATSVGVTVAVLDELKLLGSRFAKVILGAAVIDDILALLVLSLITKFPTELTAPALSPFFTTIATALIFVVGGIKLGHVLVRKYFDKEIEGKISNQTFLGILAYVLAYAYIAEFIGLSAIVGAFIAGITLNYSKLTHKLFELFYPLEALFTPLFFISLGMLVDIPALLNNIVPILVITILAIITKVVGCGLGAVLMKVPFKESIAVGVGMIPRGEIALIIGLYGLTALTSTGDPILSSAEYAVIASMAFLTTIIAPALIQKAVKLNAGAEI
ncbi:MAG: cation:proton antiporter [Candidatus Micrarchaeota archaeon]